MKYIISIILLANLSSCAFIYSGNKQRKEQTEIIRLIKEKNRDFAQCAKKTDIFKQLDQKRVPVEVNKDAVLEKFKLDDKKYPGEFTDCLFDVVELIQFPKSTEFELIKVEQPFIFKAKN